MNNSINYINSTIINNTITPILINGNNLELVILNGIIYRSDQHTISIMRHKPAYFGDYQSAIKYIKVGDYLKYYKTKRPLRLLNLDNTTENIVKLYNFFINYLLKQDNANVIKIQITYILLEIAYGLVINSMKNLDTFNLDINFIGDYLSNVCHIDNDVVYDIVYIIAKYTKESIIPSRFSLRQIDKLIMDNLKELLTPYNFDGIWFDSKYKSKEEDKELCRIMNQKFFDVNSDKLTCVPSEIGIFEPIKTLHLYKILKYVNNKFINIYKYKYNKYKSKYLKLKN